jgi:hypothetical protein
VSHADSAKAEDEREELEVLRAKYHDYCSAQLADLLLYLSPDEIYLLAQKAARDIPDVPLEAAYAQMVELATAWLARKVALLPPFEVWLEDYRAHPDRYEEYLMGLWESDVEGGTDSH